MHLKIYDARSHVRRMCEADPTGLPFRSMIDGMAPSDVHVWVWDGPGGNSKRRALYPGYKSNRAPLAENMQASLDTFREMLGLTRAVQIMVPGYEADDVISTLCRQYSGKVDRITVVSTDRDLCALTTLPGVFHSEGEMKGVPANWIRLYKATVGDPSDTIPGIKGFGAKSWERCHRLALLRWFEQERWPSLSSTEEGAERFDIPLSCARWLIENEQLARTFWDIVGFYDVPNDIITAGTTTGTPNQAALSALMKKWMQ